jgi:serine/threonine protein kinase
MRHGSFRSKNRIVGFLTPSLQVLDGIIVLLIAIVVVAPTTSSTTRSGTTTVGGVVTAERAYPLGCSLQDRSYYDYESSIFPPPGIPIKTTEDFMLVQRLGAGKFSDVFEAVDVELEKNVLLLSLSTSTSTSTSSSKMVEQQQQQQLRHTQQSSFSSFMDRSIDPETLVVLKCLKPVAERKIKRELLILQHASKLPNLARLLAIVIPPGYYSTSSPTSKLSTSTTTTTPATTSSRPTNGAPVLSPSSLPATAVTTSATSDSTTTTNNNNNINMLPTTNQYKNARLQPMPTLVLQHGRGDWLCHPIKGMGNSGSSSSITNNSHIVVTDGTNSNNNHNDSGYLKEDEIRYYLFHLLVALDELHAVGIMHRDVKPRNVLIDRSTRTLMLIDLGLADFYLPQTKYNVRVASRHYKSPELLVGYESYDYAIDLWGVGCILAGLLLRREPFFRGKDNVDQLATIVAVLGTADLHRYMAKYKIEMTSDIRQIIAKYTLQGGDGNQVEWTSFVADPAVFMPSPEGIDLLSKLLRYDHIQRLTAHQAMQHPFFDPVRMQIQRQLHERTQQPQLRSNNNNNNNNGCGASVTRAFQY